MVLILPAVKRGLFCLVFLVLFFSLRPSSLDFTVLHVCAAFSITHPSSLSSPPHFIQVPDCALVTCFSMVCDPFVSIRSVLSCSLAATPLVGNQSRNQPILLCLSPVVSGDVHRTYSGNVFLINDLGRRRRISTNCFHLPLVSSDPLLQLLNEIPTSSNSALSLLSVAT